MKKNRIIILKNGTDVFGKKIEILINEEIIEKISENIKNKILIYRGKNISK